MQRPLLVFLERQQERQDSTSPGSARCASIDPAFQRPSKITEQVFGKDFDHRDPESVAGFYFRESGGKFMVRATRSSVHTVLVPHMTYDSAPMVEAILAQLDPIVDFTRRADEFGWVDPIFIMTPFSTVLDVYEPSVMGGGFTYLGYGPTVYDQVPATSETMRFWHEILTRSAVGSSAISMVGLSFGASQTPGNIWFGVPEEQTRSDMIDLYAHEYGHTLGLAICKPATMPCGLNPLSRTP